MRERIITPEFLAPLLSRFWEKVRITPTCWLWTGIVDKNGYGMFHIDKGWLMRAARLSWIIHNGQIPPKLLILHDCIPGPDNPGCVNPAHLKPGTHQQNMRESVIKGQKGPPLLVPTQIAAIKSAWDEGETQMALASSFGVSLATINRVIHGKRACDNILPH